MKTRAVFWADMDRRYSVTGPREMGIKMFRKQTFKEIDSRVNRLTPKRSSGPTEQELERLFVQRRGHRPLRLHPMLLLDNAPLLKYNTDKAQKFGSL